MRAVGPDPQEPTSKVREYLRYGHLGLQFALSVGLLTYGGYWLDEKKETSPAWTLVGLFLGFAVGFYQLYDTLYGRRRGGR